MIGSRPIQRYAAYLATAALFVAQFPMGVSADEALSNIREDVRSTASASPTPASAPRDEPRKDRKRRRRTSDDGPYFDDFPAFFTFGLLVGMGTVAAVTSPYWGPRAILDDSYDVDGYFAGFPYADNRDGNLVFSRVTCDCGALLDDSVTEHAPYCAWHYGSSKTFSGRFTAEWAEQPGDMSRVGGRLQLNTTSRFGLDTQMDWLREPGTGPVNDELWLGDCNVVFRFAQSERAQFYSGVGFNWLDDPINTDFGFNFTYGADFFPAKPWVVSSSIDWGTLGRAEQFRFRTTAGLMINRVEVFAGYEYLDIDRTQLNTYVGGVAVWF